jgi:hypothetical protein
MTAGNGPGPLGLYRKPTSLRRPLSNVTRCFTIGWPSDAAPIVANAKNHVMRKRFMLLLDRGCSTF